MPSDGQPRPPLYADPELPTSIDIINAFSGGGAAIRQRLMEVPKGPNPLPATFAVILLLVGGWLTMSALTLPRLSTDGLAAIGMVDGSGRVVGAPFPAEREVVVARRSRVGLANPEELSLLPLGFDVPVDLRILPAPDGEDKGASSASPTTTTQVATVLVAGCRWAPQHAVGTRSLTDPQCVVVPAGATLAGAGAGVKPESAPSNSGTGGELVVVEREGFPTRTNTGYLWQGLVPLLAGVACAFWAGMSSLRYRRRQRRYVRIAEGRMQVPLPGVG